MMLKIDRNHIFVLLCGIPGSGKSTFLKNNMDTSNYAIISSDDIIEREAVKVGKTYSEVWKDTIDMATALTKENFRTAIAKKINIVWDQTNISAGKRYGILSQLPKEYYKIAVHFTTPFDIVQERLEKRRLETGKHIPIGVVKGMLERFEPPTREEGFDEILLA